MQPDDIYLASFPFGDVPGMKLRPVLLLSHRIGGTSEVLVAYISSVVPSSIPPSDIILEPTKPEYVSTNLKCTSVLRLHKLATIHVRSVVRKLGALSGAAADDVDEKLKAILGL